MFMTGSHGPVQIHGLHAVYAHTHSYCTIVLKSYSEGPFCHEDQTTDIDRQTADLKREVYTLFSSFYVTIYTMY